METRKLVGLSPEGCVDSMVSRNRKSEILHNGKERGVHVKEKDRELFLIDSYDTDTSGERDLDEEQSVDETEDREIPEAEDQEMLVSKIFWDLGVRPVPRGSLQRK